MSSEPLRVGIVSWDFARPRGGLGRAMKWLADALQGQGISVSVLSREREALPSYMRLTSLPGGHLLFSLFLPWILQRWIDEHRIHTVLIPTGPGGIMLFRKPKRCKVVIISYHTYWQQSRLVPGEAWKWMFASFEERTLQCADAILIASEDTRLSLEHEYGIETEKIRLIAPVFPLEAWSAMHEPKQEGLCVYVGRTDRRKGFETIEAAWPAVLARVPQSQLRVVKSGTMPDAELRALIASASLALCPAHLEGFGLFAAEAMAAGTPVIASDCEGLRRLVVHEQTGLLVPPDDTAAWSDAIVRLLEDAPLRQQMGERARIAMVERFEQRRAVQQWIDALQIRT